MAEKNGNIATQSQEYDTIVVGSGITGGGGENVEPFFNEYSPGEGIHERMGRDPENSVLNGRNQAHDVPT